MTPNAIAANTGLPLRRVRYVLEHEVLPGMRQRPEGYGKEWKFTDFEAFSIALAAFLLDVGLRRDAVASFLQDLAGKFGRRTKIEEIPLYSAYTGKPATLTIVDGRHVRLSATRQKGIPGGDVDTGWFVTGAGPAAPPHEPVVRIEVDLVALRNRLKG